MVSMADRTETVSPNFNAIRISIASPEQIKAWSHGEVTKPETINYRTLRPEKDGLFCERLFGPTKDWECFCGKYKRIRYRGVVCDRCGVEVTRAKVRRERMGHIELAAPVAHIWFSKTNPSRLGVLLDLPPRNLERVLYFSQHIIIAVDETARQEAIDAAQLDYDLDVEKLRENAADRLAEINQELLQLTGSRRSDVTNNHAAQAGRVQLTEAGITLIFNESVYPVPENAEITVDDGEIVAPGMILASVAAPREVYDLPDAAEIAVDAGEDVVPGMILASIPRREVHPLPDTAEILVDAGENVAAGRPLATVSNPDDAGEVEPTQITAGIAGRIEIAGDALAVVAPNEEITASIAGRVETAAGAITIAPPNEEIVAEIAGRVALSAGSIAIVESREYAVPDFAAILVQDGATVQQNEMLFDANDAIKELQQQEVDTRVNLAEAETELGERLKTAQDDLNDIQKMRLLAESRFRDLGDRYPGVFRAGMGAEAILEILRGIDLEALRDQLIRDMHSTSGQRRQKAIKRLRVVEAFRQSGSRGEAPGEGSRVENMILTMMPVLPPELRPMVQLDGGRFATSDLNDLYRRVINRNNRLKRLMNLFAPEIIIRNEKRMLQEAVDALIDNGRRGRPIQGSHNHKLKSLSDLLRGKQGRFRQNLLGKRVDYSGRSVIVVGPELKMDECGLPRRMALELFKPFVMYELVKWGIAPNIKNAKRMVERARGEVWDILEEVIKDRPVLLNRAPTLHRLGIQAFKPRLIDGNAIQIHPLVCSAFNADFDGDQMAVHVPLSQMAVLEANETMLSTHNMLSPASGQPLVAPTLDMVMGCFYLTQVDDRPDIKGVGRKFHSIADAREAHADGELDLRAPIRVRRIRGAADRGSYFDTSLGRLLFNEALPDKFVNNENLSEAARIQNKHIDRNALNALTADLHRVLKNHETAAALDGIKNLGFQYATSSGITIAINDIQVSPEKANLLADTENLVDQYNEEFQMGLISEEERYNKIIDAWAQASFQTAALVSEDMSSYGGIGLMALSGTKGNASQINQMAGMRGSMNRPRSRTAETHNIIEMPVKSNFREGMTALEYFISTHGARKGLTDTALNTASSGYLTRRLIDISQEMFVQGEDCGTMECWIPRRPAANIGMKLEDRVAGRRAARTMADPETGEILVERNEAITSEKAKALVQADVPEIMVRSPLTCANVRGVCRVCYGDLAATGELVQEGQAVGIIAAQSIGEPGTQLTMRVFHTGGARRTHSLEDEEDLKKAREMQAFANSVSSESGNLRIDSTELVASLDQVDAVVNGVSRGSDALAALNRFGEAPKLLNIVRRIRGNSGRYVQELQAFVDRFREEDDPYRPVLERLIRRAPEYLGNLDEKAARIPDDTIIRTQYTKPKGAELQVEDGSPVSPGTVLATIPRLEHPLPEDAEVLVDDGEQVEPGALLANIPDPEGEPVAVVATIAGQVEVARDAIRVIPTLPNIIARNSGLAEITEEGIQVIRANGEAFKVLQDLKPGFDEESREAFDWMQNISSGCQTIVGQLREGVETRNLDIAGGLPTVEAIFEARVPKDAAIISDLDGTVELEEDNAVIRVINLEEYHEEYPLPPEAKALVADGDMVDIGHPLAEMYAIRQYALPPGAEVMVDDGEQVAEGTMLASVPAPAADTDADGETAPQYIQAEAGGTVALGAGYIVVTSDDAPIAADAAGRVEIGDGIISVIWEEEEVREYPIPATAVPMFNNGDPVSVGDALTSGQRNPHDTLRIQGKEIMQAHLIDQVQAVYRAQGVTIHDKHIEIILRQMLRRVQVKEPGDTDFIPGEVVDKAAFQEQVERVLAEGGEPATAEQVLMGVTRASLRTDSFLSAASFQETTRVLTEAAVRGQQDYLLGLKENVIIGRLIPAQVEIPGMADLLKPKPAPDLAAMAPGGWLRSPAGENEGDAAGLNLFAPEADDDGFERMVQAVTRSYAKEDADDDEEDDEDLFDDDDDEEAADAAE